MSQENSLNIMEKYFMPGRITQLIGQNSSLKENFISVYLAYKTVKNCTKTIFIYSKPTLNIRYIYEIHKQVEKESFSEENLEKLYLFFEFIKFDSMGEFIMKNLPALLEKEKTVSHVVINNLNNFFSTTSYKYTHNPKIYNIHLMNLARKFGINIIYLNDIFFYCETKFLYNVNINNYNQENVLGMKNNDQNNNNEGDNNDIRNKENLNKYVNNNYINIVENVNEIEEYYNKEPVNSDLISEFCSHILIAEPRKPRAFFGNFSEEDFIEQGVIRVVKSNHKPHQNYLVTINKKDFTYNIEIC